MPGLWILGESQVAISNGKTLDGLTQGDGSHLVGETITLLSNGWQEVQIADDDPNFADNDLNQTLAGAETIDGTLYAAGTVVEGEYRLVLKDPAGTVYEVVGFNLRTTNPSYGTIEGLAFLGPPGAWPPVGTPLTVVSAHEGPGNSGSTATGYQDYVTPPCFTPGTLIDTPTGPRPVETLRPGDLVRTLDRGARPLRLVLETALAPARLAADPGARPLRIPAGALGAGLPARDLVVSPQHRMLMSGSRCELMFGEAEVLVAARHLPCAAPLGPGAWLAAGGVRYLHLLFDRHEIIFAEGAPTESFLPGDTVLAGAPALAERIAALGALAPVAPARPILRGWEAAALFGGPARRAA